MNIVADRWRRKFLALQTNWLLERTSRSVSRHASPNPNEQPIVFFNASTRLRDLSQNAAFQLLTSWALRLAGIPVVHFVCHAGMSRCVLGTNQYDHTAPPPCVTCIRYSQRLVSGAEARWFSYQEDASLSSELENRDLDRLSCFEYQGMPLGSLVLPSLRWILRRHHLPDDEPTRFLFRQYILSAWNVAQEFKRLIDDIQPKVVVVFNGVMFPEAVAGWVAKSREVRVVTHEVGFQPLSAFFTDGQATAYPIEIPPGFELTSEQNRRLDVYLEKRFQGEFTMAGIRFWPHMRGLSEEFLNRVEQFEQVVPIFTNVAFDTSQVHANVVFPQMFAWLDLILEIIRANSKTLFIIRAHPDEKRAGTRKLSRESVSDWVINNHLVELPNIVFIDSQEYISSYELILRAKFIMVYSSSIGLEASVLGKPVLCGGQSRYTRYPIVFFPQSPEAYREQAQQLLNTDHTLQPPEHQQNARRFLYFQLFKASLSFENYLYASSVPGYVNLRPFHWHSLLSSSSLTSRILLKGLTDHAPFLISE
ncbi:MAG: hypothetical protein AB1345_00075 [Chloroflexota bacterium]